MTHSVTFFDLDTDKKVDASKTAATACRGSQSTIFLSPKWCDSQDDTGTSLSLFTLELILTVVLFDHTSQSHVLSNTANQQACVVYCVQKLSQVTAFVQKVL